MLSAAPRFNPAFRLNSASPLNPSPPCLALVSRFTRLRAMNWAQLAAEGVSVEQAMVLKGCSREVTVRRLQAAAAVLSKGMGARLAEGSFEAAAAECGLQLLTVAVPETRDQCLMPRSEIDRLTKVTLAVPHEGLMQELYSRQPVPGALDARGKALPAFENEYDDRSLAA